MGENIAPGSAVNAKAGGGVLAPQTVEVTFGVLAATNNLSDLADSGAARSNLHIAALTPAACVATANVALSGLQTIDGYTLVAGDYVLLTAQSTASQNGVWVAAAGSWTRPTEFPSGGVVKGRTCAVINGTAGAGSVWLLQAPSAGVTINTTAQTWTKASQSVPALAQVGTQYVTTTGNDAHDGLTWATAKATINAAIAGLPTVTSSTVTGPAGRVWVGAGVATNMTSRRRTASSAAFTSNSAVVNDTGAASSDVGAFVSTGNNLATGTVPVNTTILSVIPGVSFTMSANAGQSGTGTAYIDNPAVVHSPGVSIEGVAIPGMGDPKNGPPFTGLTSATTIKDTGSGITWRCSDPGLNDESRGYEMKNILLNGNGTAYEGIYFGDSDNDLVMEQVWATGYTGWGMTIASGGGYAAYIFARECWFANNGTSGAAVNTGALLIGGGALTNYFINCHFSGNYGWGICINGGGSATFANCEIDVNHASAVPGSGAGAYVNNSDRHVVFDFCWFEANVHGIHVENGSAQGAVSLRHTTFSGDGVQDYGVITAQSGTSTHPLTINLDRCSFAGHSSGWGINNVCPNATINWENCDANDTNGFISQGSVTSAQAALQMASSAYPNGPIQAGTAVEYDLGTDLSNSSPTYTDTITGTFTPTGTAVRVDLTGTVYNLTSGGRCFFQVTDGTTTKFLGAPVSGFNGSDPAIDVGGVAILTGYTAGIQYTFKIQSKVDAGTLQCRASSQAAIEYLRMVISNA